MQHVYVRLSGGLGNQLFQYAAARALAIRHDAEVKLDVTGFETHGLRRFGLDIYSIAATIASRDEMRAISAPLAAKSGPFRRARAQLGRVLGSGLKQPGNAKYREAHYHYDTNLSAQSPPVLLEGYWQSERYFKDIADTLRTELTPHEPMEPVNAAIAEAIASNTAVSVHVRRGDYISNQRINAYHGVCSLDYSRAAVEHIADHVSNVHFFVFSDDPEWTEENLKTGLPATYVVANPPDRGFRDLQLMSHCGHHIIANSSFSWWGAWLNASPDKIVVAPAQWFAVDDKNTSDLIPEGWMRL